MGFQDMSHDMQVDQDGKIWVLAGIPLPLPLNPIKIRSPSPPTADEEKEDDEHLQTVVVTPRGEASRIPEARPCPPAPKKPRTVPSHGCSFDGDHAGFFRVPADLESVFVRRTGRAN